MKVTGGYAKTITDVSLIVCLFIFIHTSQCIDLGLIAGDQKRFGSPLVQQKVSHNAPIFNNVNPVLPNIPDIAALPPKPVPKLPAKPPPVLTVSQSLKRRTRSPLTPFLPVLPKPFMPSPIISPFFHPVIPHLPLLPIVPPIVPPFLPIIPPRLLKTPTLTSVMLPSVKPLKVSILERTPLEKALGTVKLPGPFKAVRRNVLRNLLDLKRKGSLTTPEFFRFKRLLLS